MRITALTFLFLSLLFTGCQENKGYFISGNVEGIEDGKKVYLSKLDASTRVDVPIDTMTIRDGQFNLDMPEVESPYLGFLQIEGFPNKIQYIAENQKIRFDVHYDSLLHSKVSGGKENEALSEYIEYIREINKKMTGTQNEMRKAKMSHDSSKMKAYEDARKEIKENEKLFKKELLSRNQDSYLSAMLLMEMLSKHTSAEINAYYEKLSDRIKRSDIARDVKSRLERISSTEVGGQAPEFNAPNTDGEMVSLKESLGKITIVEFWASWCVPCRAENPNLVKMYSKYKDKGLRIISVSMDREGQKENWLNAIANDNMSNWTHVSNLAFWNEPVAKKYGVQAIPASFLLDENRLIVAKNLKGDALDQEIGCLLDGPQQSRLR
ncbi:TlpA disulfide reductase family protein [Parapedobacter tibetensis]|uniref:TlpA disulfide reductase family protein n=1 Tax=Parapedobacter tibetensis TaxID=2972951 RepID=UPI00214DC4B2|nr:TlpA disulfide reductase family protein [Parapedobacter tibetensis]